MKHKKHIRKRSIAIFVGAFSLFLLCTPVIGANTAKNILVNYRNIKIKVNGLLKQTETEPFIYNSSTYVPLRFVAESLNADVAWDDATGTISIAQKASPEAIEALKELNRQFGKDSKSIRIVEALYNEGTLFFYVEQINRNNEKENYYYNTQTMDCVYFLNPVGG